MCTHRWCSVWWYLWGMCWKFWKRPEIMKWIVYVLALPKNYSIMQHALFIILRSVQMMAQAIFFSPYFQCSRIWVLAEIHLIGTITERKNMDPTRNCAIIWTLLRMMKSARCMILSLFVSANTYTIHFIISGRFQNFQHMPQRYHQTEHHLCVPH